MKIEDIRRMAHDVVESRAVESDRIEYKKTIVAKDGVLKTVCAFANNYMNREIGLLLIGIEEEDDETTGRKAVPVRPISGIDEAKIESIENELKSLLALIHPKPVYHLIQDKIDDKFYIVVAVEPGNDGPYETDRRAETDKKINLRAGRYIRVRRDSRLPNKREEFELLKKFANFRFTSELNERATLDDLNYEYMKEYLARTHAAEDIRSLSKLEMAKALHLIDYSEYGGYRAKNFAVLMFADNPDEFIPYAYVQMIREVVGTDKMESTIFRGPVWMQARRVRDYFRDYVMRTYTIRERGVSGAHRVSNWPLETFEELSTNCILHKEYARPQYVGIYVYKDRLSFVNHNRPLPPITIEDLNEKTEFDDRQYLNDELKEMFFKLDLIQSYGSGVRRAKKAMADNGSPDLVWSPNNETDDYTQVIAYINEEFARIQNEEDPATETVELKKKSDVEKSKKLVDDYDLGGFSPKIKDFLSTCRGKKLNTAVRLLEMIASNSRMTIADAERAIGLSPITIKRYLKEFQSIDILRREGGKKGGKWILQ